MEKLRLREIIGSLFKFKLCKQLSHRMALLCWAMERDVVELAYTVLKNYVAKSSIQKALE